MPDTSELQSGAVAAERAGRRGQPIVDARDRPYLQRGEAFTADGELSSELRAAVTEKAYGFTVPAEFGGLDGRLSELALVEEDLAANGFGPLAVEISGELTIGAGSLLCLRHRRPEAHVPAAHRAG